MHARLLVTALTLLTAFVAGQGLADERPLWNSTVGDLIGIPPTETTPVTAAPGPSSVNIEFIVDQCDAGAGEPIDLAELQPESKPEPESGPKTTAPDPMDIAVAPDAVLPSLDSLSTPAPLRPRGPIEISPSILYLP